MTNKSTTAGYQEVNFCAGCHFSTLPTKWVPYINKQWVSIQVSCRLVVDRGQGEVVNQRSERTRPLHSVLPLHQRLGDVAQQVLGFYRVFC